jgi:phosphoesterase RecJ-like protein
MATRRTQKIGESMRHTIGELIQRNVKDPRIGFITITAVRVTPDLSRAHVYYTVLGDENDAKGTQAGLQSAAPFLRSETARRIRMKTMPELEFHLDDTAVKGQRVDEIIDQIHHDDASDPLRLPQVAPELDVPLRRVVELLDGTTSVGIVCHIGPDGDALGSLLAMAMALDARGIRVQASWDGESVELPAQYDFLPGADLLVPAAQFRPPEVALALDCASADRMGVLRERIEKAGGLINIDHHTSNTRFGALNIVDEDATSTAELVLQLLVRMGAEITSEIATCLYTGLVTDAGQFSYTGVTPRTHATAAFLLQRGVDVADVSQKLYESFPFSYLKVLGRALDRARLETDPVFVVSHLTQDDLAEFAISWDDTDDVINTIRAIRDCDVALLLKQREDGRWKGSLRSKGATDVGAIAQHLGGGGHRLAAGFDSELGFDETIEAVRRELVSGPSSPDGE